MPASEHVDITHLESPTNDGWRLAIRRVVDPAHLDTSKPPLLVVTGYGMNSFIIGYHPTGDSLEAYLARRGFEVWVSDLRGQGDSRRNGHAPAYGIDDLVLRDVGAHLRTVIDTTSTRADRVHTLGCSLGGSLIYGHLAVRPGAPIATVAALGAPLRWEKVHPLLRVAFASPWLAGRMPHRGYRRIAGAIFPLALKVPKALHFYMHPEITDTSNYRELLKTVADTSPRLNRQIAHWVRQRDLVVHGLNVTDEAARFDRPLLCVLANADGVVPAPTALSAYEAWGDPDRQVLRVGDDDKRFAHADLFISDYSEELVFRPLADWFDERS